MYGLFWQMPSNRWVSMVVFIRAVCCLWFRPSKECHERGVNGQQVWERTLLWFRSFQFPTAWTRSFFQVTLRQYFKTIIENCLMPSKTWALSADNSPLVQPLKGGMPSTGKPLELGLLFWCTSWWWDPAHRGTKAAFTYPSCSVSSWRGCPWSPNGVCMFFWTGNAL